MRWNRSRDLYFLFFVAVLVSHAHARHGGGNRRGRRSIYQLVRRDANRVHTKAIDAEGRQRLARYMIRCPFSLEKMRYAADSGMVIYRSKPHATLKRKITHACNQMAAAADEPHPGQA